MVQVLIRSFTIFLATLFFLIGSKLSAQEVAGGGTIVVDSYMGVFTAEVGGEHIQNYFVYGYGFPPGQAVFIQITDALAPFTISTSSDSGFGSMLEIMTTNPEGEFSVIIHVKYAPLSEGPHSATITHSSEGAITQELLLDGNVTTTPVEWLSFSASAANGEAVLDWSTAAEKDNSHFEVEFSENPTAGFEVIGRISSKVQNSRFPSHYRFYPLLKGMGNILYFRIKQVDLDGAFSYSKIIVLENPVVYELKVIMPGPASHSSKLNVRVAEMGELQVQILNTSGAEVYNKSFYLNSGQNLVELLWENKLSAAGVYILSTEFKGSFRQQKFFKQ